MEKRIFYTDFASPVGQIYVACRREKIVKVSMGQKKDKREKFFAWLFRHFPNEVIVPKEKYEEKILHGAEREILEYLRGGGKELNLPYTLEGTDFQKLVWGEIKKIPRGQTLTYGELAVNAVGNILSARACGGACNKNPLPLIIPCHRVLGKKGMLTGFEGGIETKKFLLDLEKGENK